jgi:hypothetical protein
MIITFLADGLLKAILLTPSSRGKLGREKFYTLRMVAKERSFSNSPDDSKSAGEYIRGFLKRIKNIFDITQLTFIEIDKEQVIYYLLGQTPQNNGFDCRLFFWIGIFDFRLKVLEKR